MKKIKTLFKKNLENMALVTSEFDINNKWVLTDSMVYQKLDGTACMIKNGKLYRRFDAKKKRGKVRKIPEGAIPCQERDEKSGSFPHWIPCIRDKSSDKYHFMAFDKLSDNEKNKDGTYELIGEKINGGKELWIGNGYFLISHKSMKIESFDCSKADSYNYVKDYLKNKNIEGLVFHEINGNRMCKIRKKDFGFKW